jgi:hypothetical protein
MGSRSTIQTGGISNASRRVVDDTVSGDVITGPLGPLVHNLQDLERTLSDEKGPFELFGLFLREGASDKWDLVVAAGWFADDKRTALDVISGRLKIAVGSDGLRLISRIVPLASHDRFLSDVRKSVTIEHGAYELGPGEFGDVTLTRAIVITSQRPRLATRRGIGQ